MKINKVLAISLMCSGLLLVIVPMGIVVDAAGVPSKLDVVVAPNPIIAEGSEQEYGNSNGIIFVSLQDSLGRPVQASRDIALEVSSSDLGVGSIPRGPWKIAKDDYYVRVNFSCTFFFIFEPRFTNTFRFGSTTITASADGLTSGQAVLTTVPQGGNASRLKTYAGVPKIPVSAKSAPIEVQVLDSEGIPTKPTTSFEITLSASADIVEFNSRSWQWGRDSADFVSYMGAYVRGRVAGLAKITASASGFATESATVEVIPSDITNTATSLSTQIVGDFDFAISAEPSSRSVVLGGSTSYIVTVRLTKGSAERVDLSAVGLPSGAAASLSPPSLFPTGMSTANISVSSGVSSGTYRVTFLAESDGLRRSTSVDLVVSGGGCLIATAAYGSELAPEVQFLREFRDKRISQTFAGSNFMAVFNTLYYSFSPSVARYIWTHQTVRQSMRGLLYPLLGALHISSSAYSTFGFEPELAALFSGILASSLIGLLYLSLPVTGILWLLRRRVDARVADRITKSLGILMAVFLVGFTVSQLFPLPPMMMVVTVGIVLTGLSLGSILPALLIMKKWCSHLLLEENRGLSTLDRSQQD